MASRLYDLSTPCCSAPSSAPGSRGIALATLAACGSDKTACPTVETLLDITNDTNVTIWSVRIRGCGSQNWGPDLLEADIIPPSLGQSFEVAPGCVDIKLVADPAFPAEKVWTGVVLGAGEIVSRTLTSWTAP